MTTVTIPALPRWITANASTNRHWRHRHGLVSAWREAAALHARHAPPVPSPFAVEATIHRPDRRITDLDGAVATVKACIDGLRDASVIEADDTRHMQSLHVRHGEPDKVHPRIVLTITPLPVEGQTERTKS